MALTVKTWHKEGSSYPILVDQNPETPLQCYYAILNRAFGKHLAEPVPSTQDWANFEKLDWKCTGEDFTEFDYRDLSVSVKSEFNSAKQSTHSEMEKLSTGSEKYKIFAYFVKALEDGEEHLRFFVSDDSWFLVNWGMHSDPKYVLVIAAPKVLDKEDPVENGTDTWHSPDQVDYSKQNDPNIVIPNDADIHDPLEDHQNGYIPPVPPYNPATEELEGDDLSGRDNPYPSWLKWLLIILLVLVLIYFFWWWLSPVHIAETPVDKRASITENQNEEYLQNGVNKDIGSKGDAKSGKKDPFDKTKEGKNENNVSSPPLDGQSSDKNPSASQGSSDPKNDPDNGMSPNEDTQNDQKMNDANRKGKQESSPRDQNRGAAGENGRPENLGRQGPSGFNSPRELDPQNQKNYGGLSPKEGNDLDLSGNAEAPLLVGEIYKYELEEGIVYYLFDKQTGKKYVLDYESYNSEDGELPPSKEGVEI